MRNLFCDSYGLRPLAVFLIAAVVIVGALAILWAVLPNHGGCAQGYHGVVTGYMPMVVGKVVTIIPITTCVPN